MELGEELDQLVLVPQQDVQDRLGLVGVGNKDLEKQESIIGHQMVKLVVFPYLEYVEGFELDVSRLLLEHVHHQLQVVGVGNVAGHHLEQTKVE